jgi:hypothetical protein
MSVGKLYENDFFGWTQRQTELLRSRRWSEVDIEHLIEEVESMGASERRELVSHLEVLLMHLLKWQFQPQRRGRSWELTIIEQRERLKDHLESNPSLASPATVGFLLAKAYKYALIGAQRETGLLRSAFPSVCPYTLEQMLDEGFFPDEGG